MPIIDTCSPVFPSALLGMPDGCCYCELRINSPNVRVPNDARMNSRRDNEFEARIRGLFIFVFIFL
ncbi:MAG: hypothetical protein ACP5MG_09110 [Verrucomicrobiia bacterium]